MIPNFWKIVVKVFLAGTFGLLTSQSCSRESNFYIESLNMNIDIVPTSGHKLRVYVYDADEERGKNFIDIVQGSADLPNVSLCFPLEDKNKVYIIDHLDFVENYEASDLDFVHLYVETVKNAELISVEKMERRERQKMRIDSVTDSIPSITVRLNAYFRDLSVWENQNYLGVIHKKH